MERSSTFLITSLQNAKVKQVALLQQKSSERLKKELFVVEGRRELMHCLRGGYQLEALFLCSALYEETTAFERLLSGVRRESLFEVTPEVYAKMAYRGGTEGILGVFHARSLTLADLRLPPNPLLVVLESVAISLAKRITSIGSLFHVPCVPCTSADCIGFLKSHGIQILTAQLQDSRLYYHADMTLPTAIVMGTEATGLTDSWRKTADAHIRIPMLGQLDSLNVSVSAAILLFEAVRQRENRLS